MAGVNLNEENARILATSSELVGTKIRSCKDESFLPTGLLHRRVIDAGTAPPRGDGKNATGVAFLLMAVWFLSVRSQEARAERGVAGGGQLHLPRHRVPAALAA